MKVRLNVALAAVDSGDTNAYICSMIVIMLRLYKRNTKPLDPEMKEWAAGAARFAKTFGLAKLYTKVSNYYAVKYDVDDDALQELGVAMAEKKASFEGDNTINHEQLAMLKDLAMHFRFSSETQVVNSWDRLRKRVRYFNNPRLASTFVKEDEKKSLISMKEIGPAATQMRTIYKKVTGTEGSHLNIYQLKHLRESNPDLINKYSKAAKVVNEAIKKERERFVRTSGELLVTIDDFAKHLDSLGVPHNLPRGFIGGKLDETGKCYTAEGLQLDKIPSGPVRMNPDYDPATNNTFVIKSTDAAWEGRKPEFRTIAMNKANAKERFSQVREFISTEQAHRAAWTKDILAEVGPKDKAGRRKQGFAVIVELIHGTSARIGDIGNKTDGKDTYGMSTLLVKHLALSPKAIEFDYTGKKGAHQGAKYPVKDAVSKKVLTILKEMVAGKQPDDHVFTVDGKRLTRAAVNNQYLKKMGIALSIHKFRNVAGTRAAIGILAKSPFKKGGKHKQKEVETWFKEAALEIGKMLNHRNGEKITSSTSIASYIDQQLIADFFIDLGLRKPTWLKKIPD